MKPEKIVAKMLVLPALLSALAALCLMTMPAALADEAKAEETAISQALPQVSITLTSKGIVAVPSSLEGGNYLLTIKNDTSTARGIEMIGIDLETSPTVRYTKVLEPGETEQFRWYFAAGKTAYVRDVLSWTHVKTGATTVTFGEMRKAIDVN